MSIHVLVLCMLAQLIPVKVKVTTRRGRRPFALTARVRPAYSKEVSKAPNLAKSGGAPVTDRERFITEQATLPKYKLVGPPDGAVGEF